MPVIAIECGARVRGERGLKIHLQEWCGQSAREAQIVNTTPTQTTRVTQELEGSGLHIFCAPLRVISHSFRTHLTLTTSTSSLSLTSLIFRQSLQHAQDLRYTIPIYSAKFHGRVTDQRKSHLSQVRSPNSSRPKRSSLKTSSPEQLSLNLGTDPYQRQERFMRNNRQNPIAEDMDEFGKVGAATSSHRWIPIMTQRKAFSPLYMQGRGRLQNVSNTNWETCCDDTGERNE